MLDESNYYIALIAGAFALAGALLGAWITYRFALGIADRQACHAAKLAEKQARRTAGLHLRDIFAPALGQIDLEQNHGSDHGSPNAFKFASQKLHTYATAIEKYRPFVLASREADFEKAWRAFHGLAKDETSNFVADETENLPRGQSMRLAIEALLNIAEADSKFQPYKFDKREPRNQ